MLIFKWGKLTGRREGAVIFKLGVKMLVFVSFKVLFIYVSPKLKWIETILLTLGNE